MKTVPEDHSGAGAIRGTSTDLAPATHSITVLERKTFAVLDLFAGKTLPQVCFLAPLRVVQHMNGNVAQARRDGYKIQALQKYFLGDRISLSELLEILMQAGSLDIGAIDFFRYVFRCAAVHLEDFHTEELVLQSATPAATLSGLAAGLRAKLVEKASTNYPHGAQSPASLLQPWIGGDVDVDNQDSQLQNYLRRPESLASHLETLVYRSATVWSEATARLRQTLDPVYLFYRTSFARRSVAQWLMPPLRSRNSANLDKALADEERFATMGRHPEQQLEFVAAFSNLPRFRSAAPPILPVAPTPDEETRLGQRVGGPLQVYNLRKECVEFLGVRNGDAGFNSLVTNTLVAGDFRLRDSIAFPFREESRIASLWYVTTGLQRAVLVKPEADGGENTVPFIPESDDGGASSIPQIEPESVTWSRWDGFASTNPFTFGGAKPLGLAQSSLAQKAQVRAVSKFLLEHTISHQKLQQKQHQRSMENRLGIRLDQQVSEYEKEKQFLQFRSFFWNFGIIVPWRETADLSAEFAKQWHRSFGPDATQSATFLARRKAVLEKLRREASEAAEQKHPSLFDFARYGQQKCLELDADGNPEPVRALHTLEDLLVFLVQNERLAIPEVVDNHLRAQAEATRTRHGQRTTDDQNRGRVSAVTTAAPSAASEKTKATARPNPNFLQLEPKKGPPAAIPATPSLHRDRIPAAVMRDAELLRPTPAAAAALARYLRRQADHDGGDDNITSAAPHERHDPQHGAAGDLLLPDLREHDARHRSISPAGASQSLTSLSTYESQGVLTEGMRFIDVKSADQSRQPLRLLRGGLLTWQANVVLSDIVATLNQVLPSLVKLYSWVHLVLVQTLKCDGTFFHLRTNDMQLLAFQKSGEPPFSSLGGAQKVLRWMASATNSAGGGEDAVPGDEARTDPEDEALMETVTSDHMVDFASRTPFTRASFGEHFAPWHYMSKSVELKSTSLRFLLTIGDQIDFAWMHLFLCTVGIFVLQLVLVWRSSRLQPEPRFFEKRKERKRVSGMARTTKLEVEPRTSFVGKKRRTRTTCGRTFCEKASRCGAVAGGEDRVRDGVFSEVLNSSTDAINGVAALPVQTRHGKNRDAQLQRLLKVRSAAVHDENVDDSDNSTLCSDSDVEAEKDRALDATKRSDGPKHVLTLQGVHKVYSQRVYAVRGVSWSIPCQQANGNPRTCFGLLGTNGSGKTSVFRMIMGLEPLSKGRILVNGHDTTKFITEIRRRIGYCPQANCVQGDLTVLEIVSLFATLRKGDLASAAFGTRTAGQLQEGPTSTTVAEIEDKLDSLDLAKYRDRKFANLSGGNQRKVLLLLSLLWDPQLVLLDEPSAGVDPMGRQSIWTVLKQIQTRSESSFVLTTHAMEEAEALCDRVAIQHRGRLKCVGTVQHLCRKFGRGYEVRLRLDMNDDVDDPTEDLYSDRTTRPTDGESWTRSERAELVRSMDFFRLAYFRSLDIATALGDLRAEEMKRNKEESGAGGEDSSASSSSGSCSVRGSGASEALSTCSASDTSRAASSVSDTDSCYSATSPSETEDDFEDVQNSAPALFPLSIFSWVHGGYSRNRTGLARGHLEHEAMDDQSLQRRSSNRKNRRKSASSPAPLDLLSFARRRDWKAFLHHKGSRQLLAKHLRKNSGPETDGYSSSGSRQSSGDCEEANHSSEQIGEDQEQRDPQLPNLWASFESELRYRVTMRRVSDHFTKHIADCMSPNGFEVKPVCAAGIVLSFAVTAPPLTDFSLSAFADLMECVETLLSKKPNECRKRESFDFSSVISEVSYSQIGLDTIFRNLTNEKLDQIYD
ncbi:unnamed protein product [Amoebophrya sp. A120]|nr:unnamed protein product [Amoebophrya sp. A120]|eukprot:GSA120T00011634001.1